MSLQSTDNQESSQAGFTLVAVLGFLFVVALFAMPFVIVVKSNFMVSSHLLSQKRLEFLAEGLLEVYALQVLSGAISADRRANAEPGPQSCSTPEFRFSVSIQDHRGLIDLNSSSIALIQLGFEALSLSREETKQIARTIAHMRSVRNGVRPQGLLPLRIDRPSGRFVSVLELMDIETPTPLNHAELSQIFTVHSRSGRLNRILASAPLKRVLEATPNSKLPITGIGANDSKKGTYTISVSVAKAETFLQHTMARIVAVGQSPHNPFQTLEAINVGLPEERTPVTNSSCNSIFGRGVTQILAQENE